MRYFFAALFLIATTTGASACDFSASDAPAVIKRFPVIVGGKFDANNNFHIEKIYKGFRQRTITFAPFRAKDVQAGKEALVFSDYQHSQAMMGDCGAIVYKDGKLESLTYAGLLAEATVYNVVARDKATGAPFGVEDHQKYEPVSNFLRDSNDPLFLLETSASTVSNISNTMGVPAPSNDVRGWKSCIFPLKADSPYLSDDLKAGLEKTKVQSFIRSSYALGRSVGDLANSLYLIKEYDAALYVLCSSDIYGLFTTIALNAKRPELVNGKGFRNLYSLSDLDMSGLDMFGVATGGEWKNVKVENTNFTNADFTDTSLKSLNLSKANMNFATYSCKTEFPDGYDPVKNHMVPEWHRNSCKENQPPIDLSHLSPTIPEEANATYFNFGFINWKNLNAIYSKLSTIVCSYCDIEDANFTGTEVALILNDGGIPMPDHRYSRVTNTSFRNAKLKGTRFNKSKFMNVDFTGASLDGVDFQGATYDAATKWPAGFDPLTVGAHEAEE